MNIIAFRGNTDTKRLTVKQFMDRMVEHSENWKAATQVRNSDETNTIYYIDKLDKVQNFKISDPLDKFHVQSIDAY